MYIEKSLKNKYGDNPFGIIEMLPDSMRPSDEVISHAKSMYTKINMPDLVRAWDKKVIFAWYFKRNQVTCMNEMIFSEGNMITWEWE